MFHFLKILPELYEISKPSKENDDHCHLKVSVLFHVLEMH